MSRTMNLGSRVGGLRLLGRVLHSIINGENAATGIIPDAESVFLSGLDNVSQSNPWFTPRFVRLAVAGMAKMLEDVTEGRLLSRYPSLPGPERKARRILLVAPGNIPAAGFHDMLCVLLSGHRGLMRLSSDDDVLLPLTWDLLTAIEPAFRGQLEFVKEPPRNFNAVIASGSNNTSRYFEYYFGKHPSIIRGNRNSAAVLRGDESIAELRGLSDDICQYFGMGCRSVSKLHVPAGYSFDALSEVLRESYGHLADHHKFFNNYEYRKAIHMIGNESFFDTGFMLIRRLEGLASPLAVLHYEEYGNEQELLARTGMEAPLLQCLVSSDTRLKNAILPGTAQSPGFFDFADGVDTLRFLAAL